MDLFSQARAEQISREAPLAARMRPRTLDEYVGQEHVIGPGRLLRRAIQADQLTSLIFYGPAGTGKTTLAMVIANTTRSRFVTLNAVLAGVKELREVVARAQEDRNLYGQRTTLFVDEVHRWNKAQQDALLPWVENGTIVMIGATTENPWFSVNRPLLSRSRVFQLVPLTDDDLRRIAAAALADPERGFGGRAVRLEPEALEHLVSVSNGDARSLLNALELAVETTPPDAEGVVVVNTAVAEESIQRRAVLYDREGDYHFDTISAFIKSVRGSDPDAALYWLAKMVYAGEDPRFIFRRMLISASEDVGLADPRALGIVESAAAAFERVGLPEGQFHLTQAALYLATAPKSNSALGYFDALKMVEAERQDAVPTHLKDGSRDAEGLGHGEGYLYPHAYRDHWVAQQYLPDALQGQLFYEPGDQGYEADIRQQVARRREAQLAAGAEMALVPGESLTFSPGDRAQERWLQRAIGDAGRRLSDLRERLFADLALHRHDLVLDLNAGGGLLTWEALRRVPEGGVWALVREAAAAATLRQQAERLPELSRPIVLEGELDALPALLAPADLGAPADIGAPADHGAAGHGEVRFDLLIGRNTLTGVADKAAAARLLAGLAQPGAVLSLGEAVPRRGQRLYALFEEAARGEWAAAWADAEEAIYADAGDPMVNWDADDLAAALAAGGWVVEAAEVYEQASELLVTAAMVNRWFAGSGQGRPGYGQHLAAQLPPEAVAAIRERFERRLAGQTVAWHSALAVVRARLAQGTA